MHRYFFCLLFLPLASAVEIGPVPVVRVIEGDIIAVMIKGNEEQIRLLFVDTPECKDDGHGGEMDEGHMAKKFLESLLPIQAHVRLKGPKAELERDGNNRLLAIVEQNRSTDGKPQPEPVPDDKMRVSIILCVNSEIIKAGWSPYWMKHGLATDSYDASFRFAQNQADTAGAGLWTSNLKWIEEKANERTVPKK